MTLLSLDADRPPVAVSGAEPRRQRWLSLALAGAIAMPILAVLLHLLAADRGTLAHLWATVLPDYLLNTVLLSLLVAALTFSMGVTSAWLVTACRFPGSRLLEWALILPLAIPAYVVAYLYTDLLQFAGPVQGWLRGAFGWSKADYWFPEIRSLGGAGFMFGFVLYPYVYLLARAAFLDQSTAQLDVARTLGLGPFALFRRVALPLARPAIVAGMALALMETLADFGTVAYFAVPTFTTGVYRAWFAMGDRIAAAQLACGLLGFALLALALERYSRRARRFHETGRNRRPLAPYRLDGWRAALAFALCAAPLMLGFLLPALLLLRFALFDGDASFGPRYATLVWNSVSLAGIAAALAVAVAALLAYAERMHGGPLLRVTLRVAGIGYAIPGSVIAVGILIPLAAFDRTLDGLARQYFGQGTGLILTGGVVALVYAYLVRFLAVSLQGVEAALQRVPVTLDHAARSLGEAPGGVLWRVHRPLISGGLLSAGLIVFVDVLKELPATLLMRPFNFDTLAIQVYNLASDERLAEASTAALAIVAAGLGPVLILSRRIAGEGGA